MLTCFKSVVVSVLKLLYSNLDYCNISFYTVRRIFNNAHYVHVTSFNGELGTFEYISVHLSSIFNMNMSYIVRLANIYIGFTVRNINAVSRMRQWFVFPPMFSNFNVAKTY